MKHTQLLITAVLSSPAPRDVAEVFPVKFSTPTVRILTSKTQESLM